MGTRGTWLGASVLALVAASGAKAHAQGAALAPPFKQERWSEDWRHAHGSDAPFGAAWKDMAVASGVTLSLGGDARWRSEYFDAPRFGSGGAIADQVLVQRLLAHADLRFGHGARVFVQLGAHDGIGRDLPSTTDDDRFDVQQAFADFSHRFGPIDATLRVGRQELWLGSPRFVTLRDNSNLRQRHDLARLTLSSGAWNADLFAGRPTQDHPGALDDEADHSQEFYGVRLGRKFGAVTADLLYYDLDRENFAIGGAVADDRRVSVGARIAGALGDVDFDAEFLTQSGGFGAREVRAWGASFDVGRRFTAMTWSPRFGARITYGTGDSDPLDARQETFAPPFPRTSWFGAAGLVSFSNSMEAAAIVNAAPGPDLSLEFKAAGLWRADTADLLYVGTQSTLPGTRLSDAYTGAGLSLLAAWRISPNVTLASYAAHLDMNGGLAGAGIHDTSYVSAILSLRF